MGNIFQIYLTDSVICEKFKLELNKSKLVSELLGIWYSKGDKEYSKEREILSQKLEETKEKYENFNNLLQEKEKEQQLIEEKEKQEQEIEAEKIKKQQQKEAEIKKRKFEVFIEDCNYFGIDREISEMYFEDYYKLDIPLKDFLINKKLIDEDIDNQK